MKSMLKKIIGKVGDISTLELRSDIFSELYDIKAVELLPDLKVGYIPWSSFSLRPSAITLILNELVMNRSRTVIECGIGISTLYMLSNQVSSNIRVIGIDDNEEWIELVKKYLDRLEVPSERYTLIHAPIVEYNDSSIGKKWYDIKKIKPPLTEFLDGEKADILLVDGPKGNLCEKSRYQALPKLNCYLNDDFSIFLDDIQRDDEYEIGQAWSDEFKLSLEYQFEKAGVAILRPKQTSKKRTIS